MTNKFDEMEKAAPEAAQVTEAPQNTEAEPAAAGELDLDQLSNKPVGETFERVLLDGKTVIVTDAKVFPAIPGVTEISSGFVNKNKKYYKNNFQVFFGGEAVPEDKPQREYLSGCIQHINDNNEVSQPSMYYKNSKTQTAELWRIVAEFKGLKAEELDLRTFIAFLKSKPTAVIEVQSFKNPVSGKYTDKNIIKEFVK